MTELENHLLNALKRWETQFSEQYKASEQAQKTLQAMFDHTSTENAILNRQVKSLKSQVENLSKQLEQFKLSRLRRQLLDRSDWQRAGCFG